MRLHQVMPPVPFAVPGRLRGLRLRVRSATDVTLAVSIMEPCDDMHSSHGAGGKPSTRLRRRAGALCKQACVASADPTGRFLQMVPLREVNVRPGDVLRVTVKRPEEGPGSSRAGASSSSDAGSGGASALPCAEFAVASIDALQSACGFVQPQVGSASADRDSGLNSAEQRRGGHSAGRDRRVTLVANLEPPSLGYFQGVRPPPADATGIHDSPGSSSTASGAGGNSRGIVASDARAGNVIPHHLMFRVAEHGTTAGPASSAFPSPMISSSGATSDVDEGRSISAAAEVVPVLSSFGRSGESTDVGEEPVPWQRSAPQQARSASSLQHVSIVYRADRPVPDIRVVMGAPAASAEGAKGRQGSCFMYDGSSGALSSVRPWLGESTGGSGHARVSEQGASCAWAVKVTRQRASSAGSSEQSEQQRHDLSVLVGMSRTNAGGFGGIASAESTCSLRASLEASESLRVFSPSLLVDSIASPTDAALGRGGSQRPGTAADQAASALRRLRRQRPPLKRNGHRLLGWDGPIAGHSDSESDSDSDSEFGSDVKTGSSAASAKTAAAQDVLASEASVLSACSRLLALSRPMNTGESAIDHVTPASDRQSESAANLPDISEKSIWRAAGNEDEDRS